MVKIGRKSRFWWIFGELLTLTHFCPHKANFCPGNFFYLNAPPISYRTSYISISQLKNCGLEKYLCSSSFVRHHMQCITDFYNHKFLASLTALARSLITRKRSWGTVGKPFASSFIWAQNWPFTQHWTVSIHLRKWPIFRHFGPNFHLEVPHWTYFYVKFGARSITTGFGAIYIRQIASRRQSIGHWISYKN